MNKSKVLISSLEFLAKYHNRVFNENAVVAGLPLVGEDLTPSVFERAAARLGLASQVLKRDLSALNKELFPAVLLLKADGDKACVLLEIDSENRKARVVYPDLNSAVVTVSLEELELKYSGYVIYSRPEYQFDARADDVVKEAPKHWFWSAIEENRAIYKDILLAAFLINVLALAMPLFVMNVYDRVVPNQAIDTLWVLAIGVLVAITADFALKVLRTWFVDLAAGRVDNKVSARVFEKALNMKLSDRPQSTGSFVSSIQGFESVRSFFGSATVNILVDIPFVIFFTLVIGIINPYFAIPIVVGVLVLIAYALSVQYKVRSITEESSRASSMRNSVLVESISALPVIKAFNAQRRSQQQWESSTAFITNASSKNRLLTSSFSSFGAWVQQLVAISIVIIGVYTVMQGDISAGGIVAAYLLSSRAMAPVIQSAGLLNQFHNSVTAMKSLNSLMAKDTEGLEDPSKLSLNQVKGDIELLGVNLNYGKDGQNALTDINLRIKSGEKIAIIGRNGSGKSSLVKLILGLYQPDSGQVKIDGLDLQQLNLSTVRRNIGYLNQDSDLLYGSIQDNISLAMNSFDTERLVDVSNQLGLGSVINSFPDGFNHLIEEGGRNISGGQRQLIALARALINDPAILLMDEPTSSLDSGSEFAVTKAISSFGSNKTLVLITHKNALLRLVDRIVVMDSGKIIMDGRRDEVMARLQSIGNGELNRVRR